MSDHNYYYMCDNCPVDGSNCLVTATGAEVEPECPWGDKDHKFERIPRDEFLRLEAENYALKLEDKKFNDEWFNRPEY